MIRKAIIVVLTLGAVVSGALIPMSYLYPHRSFGITNSVLHTQGNFTVQIVGGFLINDGRLRYTRFGEITSRPPNFRRIVYAGFEFRQTCRGRQVAVGSTITGEPFHSSWCVPSTELETPLVPVFALLAAYPTIAFIRGPLRRRRRRKRGQCLRCGYSLEGNVTGVCPECGTEIERPSPMMNAGREESGVVAGRGWFRDQQINAIKVEIKKRYADRIRSAESKAQEKALKTERDAEIAKQVEPLIRERQADGPHCV